MTDFTNEKRILPQFPRTYHLPWKPNLQQREDLLASEKEVENIFSSNFVTVCEKIDGANAGIARSEDNPIVRNHDHILRKGYLKDTPAKIQFRSIWNWYYTNKDLFVKMEELAGPVSVYGEWLVAQHGMKYDQLPSYFIAHSVYNYEVGKFLDTKLAMDFLTQAGFHVAPVLFYGKVENFEQLETFSKENASFTSEGQREGVYVTVSDGKWITHRFKMVRAGFKQGSLWSKNKINKNELLQ